MKATYFQRGEAIDYVNSSNKVIKAGTIVSIGKRIGVAAGDIAIGETGAIEVEGVFEMPLKTPIEVTQGEELYWTETGLVKEAAGAVKAGYAAGAAEGETVLVKINA